METTKSAADRPAVDLAAGETHPRLALVLALLAVPGSTLAWELPAGGFWIGLPLAVAAIVLGLRAQRQIEGGSKLALAAIAIAALMILQMAVWTLVSVLD
jgi:hypothetical protein